MMSQNKKKGSQSYTFVQKILLFFLPVILTFLDQFTKQAASAYLKEADDLVLIPGFLELTYLENRGIAWGMFQGKRIFFLVFSVIFFVLVMCFLYRIPHSAYYLPLVIAVSGMASGAAGNFIDRFVRGYVIDFIYLSLIHFPVFNLADICVAVSGTILVLLICFRYRDQDFVFLHIRKGRLDE